MSGAWHCALGRALSHVSDGQRAHLLESLLARMSWELSQLVSPQCIGVALAVRRGDRSIVCGRDSRERDFPTESILGLLCTLAEEQKEYRVTDHSLDTLRFMASPCRTSIVVRLTLPESVAAGGDAALWLGLMCGAAPAHIEEARALAKAIGEWFVAYGPLIERLQSAWERVRLAEEKNRESIAIMHDARAPLGALKHLLQGELRAGSAKDDDAGIVVSQLGYLGDLLSRGSPQSLGGRHGGWTQCDVGEVVARVAERFALGKPQGEAAVVVSCAAHAVACPIPGIELERILTNLIGNALRFAKPGGVSVSVELDRSCRSAAILVADDGPGFSATVLRSFEERRDEAMAPSEGWGIGLVSSRRRVEEHGGSMQLRFSPQGGSLVEVRLPCVRSEEPYESGFSERPAGYDMVNGRSGMALCIVDDDRAHARSLEKLMRSRGLEPVCFSEIGAAIEHLGRHAAPVLCDVNMQNGGAEVLLAELRSRRISVRVAVMSGDNSEDVLYRVAAAGAEAFFDKPIAVEDVVEWIERPVAAA